MSVSFTLITIAEVSFGLFLIWGFWHEDKMVEFEDKLFAKLGIKRRKKHTAKIIRFSPNNSPHREKNCI